MEYFIHCFFFSWFLFFFFFFYWHVESIRKEGKKYFISEPHISPIHVLRCNSIIDVLSTCAADGHYPLLRSQYFFFVSITTMPLNLLLFVLLFVRIPIREKEYTCRSAYFLQIVLSRSFLFNAIPKCGWIIRNVNCLQVLEVTLAHAKNKNNKRRPFIYFKKDIKGILLCSFL